MPEPSGLLFSLIFAVTPRSRMTSTSSRACSWQYKRIRSSCASMERPCFPVDTRTYATALVHFGCLPMVRVCASILAFCQRSNVLIQNNCEQDMEGQLL